MTGHQPLVQIGGNMRPRAVHAERVTDSGFHQRRIVHAGMLGQNLSKQPSAQIGVFILRSSFPRELVAREKLVELLDGIPKVWVVWIWR